VIVDPLKWIFGDYISVRRRCCRLKFLRTLQPLNCVFSRTGGVIE